MVVILPLQRIVDVRVDVRVLAVVAAGKCLDDDDVILMCVQKLVLWLSLPHISHEKIRKKLKLSIA